MALGSMFEDIEGLGSMRAFCFFLWGGSYCLENRHVGVRLDEFRVLWGPKYLQILCWGFLYIITGYCIPKPQSKRRPLC